MELAQIALGKILQMSLIMIAGVFLYKLKIIDSDMNKKLSNLLLMFISPCLIISSYQVDFSTELMQKWLATFLLSIISFTLTIFTSRFLVPKSDKWDTKLERVAVIYSNCGFIGVPLLNALFGKEGVFLMTVYMTVFNVLVWSQAVTLLTGKTSIRQIVRNLCSPMVIAVLTGLLLFFLRIRLPELILSPMSSIGDTNTPFAMLVAGASLAETDIGKLIRKGRVYLISGLKLLVCPLIFILFVGWFSWEQLPLMTVYVAAACPAGTTATLLALRYGRNNVYATELLAVSTILSIVTIPLMLLFYSWMPFPHG